MLPIPTLTFRFDKEIGPAAPPIVERQPRLDLVLQVALLFQVEQDIRDNQLVLRAHHLTAKCPVNEALFEEPPLRSLEADGDIRQEPGRLKIWRVQ